MPIPSQFNASYPSGDSEELKSSDKENNSAFIHVL